MKKKIAHLSRKSKKIFSRYKNQKVSQYIYNLRQVKLKIESKILQKELFFSLFDNNATSFSMKTFFVFLPLVSLTFMHGFFFAFIIFALNIFFASIVFNLISNFLLLNNISNDFKKRKLIHSVKSFISILILLFFSLISILISNHFYLEIKDLIY